MEGRAAELCVIALVFIIFAFGPIILNGFEIWVNGFDAKFEPNAFNVTKNMVIAGIGVPFGLLLLYKGFSWLKTKRLIEDIPTSKIRSLAMGLVEIYGRVVPAKGRLIRSPHSDRDCVYYKYIIEESRSGREGSRWKKVEEAEGRTHFFIDDRTGYVLVDSKEADIESPGSADKFDFESYSEKKDRLGRKIHVRYKEYNILPGDYVYTMGTADKNPFIKETTATNNTANIMIKRGKNDRIFYISETHEKDVVKQLSLFSAWSITAAFIMIIGSIVINLFPIY